LTRKLALIAAAVTVAIALAVIALRHRIKPVEIRTLVGCIVRNDPDPRKQVAIAGVEITSDIAQAATRSEPSGLFELHLPAGIEVGRFITLHLRHPDYQPLDLEEIASGDLFVLRMTPVTRPAAATPPGPEVPVANIRVRYTQTSTATLSVGSAVQSFEVVNTGNIPCEHSEVCSPDGKWRAAIGGTSLDAGEGNEFTGARLTCIAGPCPFTKVETDNFSRGGRVISARVRNWSETTSFLLEAQVVHTMSGNTVQVAYPVKFGRGMDFTLSPLAQGPSIEAEVNGADIVYPLGPALVLPWAKCTLTVDADRTRLYHCDLEPGYRFK
jgi:hypothetical protein